MDQLQAALDTLESRNAGIHEELLQLLQSNREIRLGLNAQNGDGDTSSEADEETPAREPANEANGRVNGISTTGANSTGDVPPESSENSRNKVESTSAIVDAQENAIASQLAGINVSKGEANPSE